MSKKIEGVCHLHSETGTEGGYWAAQDNKFINKRKWWWFFTKHDIWLYEGLHILKNGDRLIIFDLESDEVLWEGVIDLIELPLFEEHAFGFWIHNDQKGIEREKWAKFFLDERGAIVITENKS